MRCSILKTIMPYFLLTCLSLVFFLPGLLSLPVVDRDEAHFAQATRQMMETGHYFQVRFQQITRFQKPPGINWLQAASVQLTGNNGLIWPYRLPSLLGALGSVLLTFFFARRFLPQRAALLGSAFLAASMLLVVEAHLSVTDAALLCTMVMMQGALWVIYQTDRIETPPWGWAALFWIAMSLGVVLKGITPLVGGLTVVTLSLVDRRFVRGLRVYRGLLVFAGVSVVWLMKLNTAEHSNYLLQMLRHDLLPKLQGGHESHGKPPLFHLLILPMTFWPASLFLWQGGVYGWKHRQEQTVRFLLSWIIPTWIFFEIMPTKLPQYVLPTFPALALLCALAVVTARGRMPSRGVRVLQVLWGVMSLIFAFSLVGLSYFLMKQVLSVSVMLVVGIGVTALVGVWFAYKGLLQRASIAVLCAAVLTYPLVFETLLPALKPLWLPEKIAQFIHVRETLNNQPLLVFGYGEPSLVFYLQTNQVVWMDNKAMLLKRLQAQSDSVLLIDHGLLEPLSQEVQGLKKIASFSGYNYNASRWITLDLVQRQEGR